MIIFPTGLNAKELHSRAQFTQSFRGKQLYKRIVNGAQNFDEISEFSLAERARLKEIFPALYSSRIVEELPSPDGSLKIKIRLRDGHAVEAVLLCDENNRYTACLSSQVGCAMACSFCKTGLLGFMRNLGRDEIMEQFYFLNARASNSKIASARKIANIVFMGMGEPLHNLAEVRASIALLSDPDALNISPHRITISTCGIVPAIYDLAENGPPVRLAVSLTSADAQSRSELMPVNLEYPLPELKAALQAFQAATGERITLELAIMGGVNSSIEAAREVIAWCRGINVQLNVIPWNKVEGLDFKTPSTREVELFMNALEAAGIPVNRRMSRGRSVNAACGQLGEIVVSALVPETRLDRMDTAQNDDDLPIIKFEQ